MRSAPKLLQQWMSSQGVSQAELVRATGISAPQINHIVKGRRGISLENAMRLAGFTGLPVEKLVNPRKVLILRRNGRAA